MKKKNKQAKDQLIDSLLEDLKEVSPDDGVLIGPGGVESSGLFSRANEASNDTSLSQSQSGESDSSQSRDKKKPKSLGQIALASEGGSYTSTVEDENDKTTLLTGSGTQSPNLSETQFLQISKKVASPPAPPIRPLSSAGRDSDSKGIAAKASQIPQKKSVESGVALREDAESNSDSNQGLKPELTEFYHSKASYHRYKESKEVAREMADEIQQNRVSPPTAPEKSKAIPPPAASSAPAGNRFLQLENARIAQERINELENEVERYRKENEMLSSSHDMTKSKIEELLVKNMHLEKQRNDFRESSESELKIFREALIAKDSEIQKMKAKIDELNSRLNADLRKIRVRERDLENRLELAKVEKTALMRAKDDTILELKRKQEMLDADLENSQRRVLELNERIELNQEQFARTVRALRLALTNIEVNEETATVVPLSRSKKAE